MFEYRVVGDGFLPRMVRSLVSALADVGRGAREPDWMTDLLRQADRRAGPETAPADGLTLWRIGYDDYPHPGFLNGTAAQVVDTIPPGGHANVTRGSLHRGTANLVTEGA